MAGIWRSLLVEHLIGAANTDGAWGYRAATAGAAEPTALAALALTTAAGHDEHVERSLAWLARYQQADGAVPVSAEAAAPHWPTALAVLAWVRAGDNAAQRYRPQIERALNWLLETRGRPIPGVQSDLYHDTTLIGWPWVAGSHSWLEPTAYALLALRATGHGEHARVREAVRLILDRALADGGWNYGNRCVFGKALRPFPGTTGIALTALAGEPSDARIAVALEYVASELPGVRAPLSLAWGLCGARAWSVTSAQAEERLAHAARRLTDRPALPHYMAMLLLAGADHNPLLGEPEGHTHG